MSNLVSMPTSLRQRLAQAETLIQHDRPHEGMQMLAQIGVELARSQPELLALIMASQLGHTSITATQTTSNVNTVRTAKKVLGVTYGVDEITTTNRYTSSRTIGFGGENNYESDW